MSRGTVSPRSGPAGSAPPRRVLPAPARSRRDTPAIGASAARRARHGSPAWGRRACQGSVRPAGEDDVLSTAREVPLGPLTTEGPQLFLGAGHNITSEPGTRTDGWQPGKCGSGPDLRTVVTVARRPTGRPVLPDGDTPQATLAGPAARPTPGATMRPRKPSRPVLRAGAGRGSTALSPARPRPYPQLRHSPGMVRTRCALTCSDSRQGPRRSVRHAGETPAYSRRNRHGAGVPTHDLLPGRRGCCADIGLPRARKEPHLAP
jgi:hypothetical protein